MKLTQLLRTKCNRLLEGAIKLSMLTAITFTVTACYAPYDPDKYGDLEWQQKQDSTEQRVAQLGKRIMERQQAENAQQQDEQQQDEQSK